ncbi:MAG TPA: glycosyltransferase family 87 protein [Candidatus Binatia bacterium]|nr:glycosyltransferase family 87 protein [Candidatus Binatia bacterium]
MRYGPIVAVLAIGALYAGWQLAGGAPESQDSKAYYYASLDDPYARSRVGGDYAYLYSPAFAQILAPLRLLPINVFVAVWTMILFVALAWTAGRLALPLLLFQPVIASIALGNIEILLAAAIVAGFTRPAAWSFVLLSKVTPGIGLVWFAVRREWRSLGIALGVTGAIVGVSFVLAPQLWFDWFDVLRSNTATAVTLPLIPGPLWLRVAIGGLIVAWGAWTDRRWTVPIGAGLAVPVGWYTCFAIMAVGICGVAIRTPGFTVRGAILAVTSRILPHRPAPVEAPR